MPPERFALGTILADRYRIVGSLGRGGMGEVYKADDLRLGQSVALKFLPLSIESDPLRLERLAAEVRTARQVSHRNVCRVYDLGEAAGHHFLSMEYVDGEDLASLLRRIGRLPPDKAIELGRQICAGLAAAHEAGFLHRDLKPANVMIDGQGRARLTDFGLAVLAGDVTQGEVAGTPAYMSPEQLEGRPLSVKSDVYALGLVLYEMFTGKRAFPSASFTDLVRQRTESHPARPSDHLPDVDPRIERVILRCLAREPVARPASALAVSAALPGGDPVAEALAAGETPSPEMVAAAGEEGSLSPPAALACMVGILALVGLVYALWPARIVPLRVPLDKPPEVLAERAREILRMSAHAAPAADSDYGFAYDESYLAYVGRQDSSPRRWDSLATGRPAAVRFWYRVSPEPMTSSDGLGRVSLSDPPLTKPGMASVVLDTQGRLLELQVVPSRSVPETAHEVDTFLPLIAAADLDAAALTALAPAFTPPVFADARSGWEGRFPGGAHQMRVEAAALAGSPVFFAVLGPWDDSRDPAAGPLDEVPVHPAPGRRSGRAAFLYRYQAFNFLMLGAGLVLAWRNLRVGRGDRDGARRLAICACGTTMTAWLVSARHSRDLALEWTIFTNGLEAALLGAALLWLLYLAIEPPIRRRWPGSLISWARLLSGRFRDPIVGRDVLIGCLAAYAVAVSGVLAHWLADHFASAPAPPAVLSLNGLLGSRAVMGNILLELVNAVQRAMLYLVLFLLLRLLLRKMWIALVVLAVVVAAALQSGALGGGGAILAGMTGAPLIDTGRLIAVLGIITFVLLRFGLLALMVMVFFSRLAFHVLPTMDLTAWYASSSRIGLALTVILASYGFVTALAGRPLFRNPLLED